MYLVKCQKVYCVYIYIFLFFLINILLICYKLKYYFDLQLLKIIYLHVTLLLQ